MALEEPGINVMVAAHNPEQTSLLHLEIGIEQALSQARKANFRSYLRIHRALINTSFLDYLDLVCASSDQVMAWSDGRENRSFAAIGEEVGFPVHSVIRFAQAGAGCLEFSEQVIQLSLDPMEEVSTGVPVAVPRRDFMPQRRDATPRVRHRRDAPRTPSTRRGLKRATLRARGRAAPPELGSSRERRGSSRTSSPRIARVEAFSEHWVRTVLKK